MVKIGDEKKNIGRRLRIEEKKSVREIASILGVSVGTVAKWIKDEGWPDPQAEKRALGKILKPASSPPPPDGPEKPPPKEKRDLGSAKAPGQMNPFALMCAPFDPIDQETLSAPLEKMVEDLFRFSAGIVAEASRWDVKTAVKLMESSGRILVAVKAPTPLPGAPKFGVVVPTGTQESYRDPPPDPSKVPTVAKEEQSQDPDLNQPKPIPPGQEPKDEDSQE